MENLKKELRSRIVKILNPIDDAQIEQLIDRFVELGVQNIDDVTYVNPDQLHPILKSVQATKLIQLIRKSLEDKENRGNTSSTQVGYKHDWSIYPSDIMETLNKGKPLTEEQMRELKRVTIRHLTHTIPSLKRSFLDTVGKAMLQEYSVLECFMGRDNKIQTQTFCFALKVALDNRNRKSEPKTTQEIEAPAIPEAYGCVKWQVANLPQGETAQSLEQKKQRLMHIFENTDKRNWNWDGEILPLLEATYSIQRKEINTQTDHSKKKGRKKGTSNEAAPTQPKTTDQIFEDWPLLFTTKGLNLHFKILTGVSLLEKFNSFLIDKDFPSLMDFLATRKRQENEYNQKIKAAMDRAIRRGADKEDATLLALVLMLITALGEVKEGIVRVVEESIDIDELEDQEDIPGPPVIFALGQTAFRAKKFYICLDGKPRKSVQKFSNALISLMALYFVMNIQYSPEAPSTLDFIQRNILDINPPSGSKLPSNLRRKGPVQRCLSKLKEQLDRFRANINEETSNSSVDGNLEEEENESFE